MVFDGATVAIESFDSRLVALNVGDPVSHVMLSLLVSRASKVTIMDRECAVVDEAMFFSVRSYSTLSPPSNDPVGGVKVTVIKGLGRNVRNVPCAKKKHDS